MSLKKPSVLKILDDYLPDNIPCWVVTFTASAWGAQGLSGNAVLNRILEAWGLTNRSTVHLGFEKFIANRQVFPLFFKTFKLCCWDTVSNRSMWNTWWAHAGQSYDQGSFDALEKWIQEQGLAWGSQHIDQIRYNTLLANGGVRARLFGCYGPGGPILDLQLKPSSTYNLPPRGWRRWGEELDIVSLPTQISWANQYLVPETYHSMAPGLRLISVLVGLSPDSNARGSTAGRPVNEAAAC